jgi:hypothetical protein
MCEELDNLLKLSFFGILLPFKHYLLHLETSIMNIQPVKVKPIEKTL